MGPMRKRGKLEHIIRFNPVKDSDGKYVPYRSFPPHMGIPIRYKQCEGRECKHYHKLRI